MGVSNGDGDGGGVDGDGSEGNSPSRQGARTETSVPRTRFCDDGRDGTFRGFLLGSLGFSHGGEYMGEEAESEAPWWAQTQGRRGPRAGRAWPLSGHVAGSLLFPFWLRLRYGKIRHWDFVPCNSENICCTAFLKCKNSRKQELALRHWLIG